MKTWWWLSFVNENGFAGVSIVRGETLHEAIQEAWATDCNPGGQVAAWQLPDDIASDHIGLRYRLLSEPELKNLKGRLETETVREGLARCASKGKG